MNFMNEWLLAVELIFSLFLNRWKNCFGPFLRYSLTKPYKKYYWPLTQFFRCFLLIITIFFAIKFDWVWNILRDRHLQTKEKYYWPLKQFLLSFPTVEKLLITVGKYLLFKVSDDQYNFYHFETIFYFVLPQFFVKYIHTILSN